MSHKPQKPKLRAHVPPFEPRHHFHRHTKIIYRKRPFGFDKLYRTLTKENLKRGENTLRSSPGPPFHHRHHHHRQAAKQTPAAKGRWKEGKGHRYWVGLRAPEAYIPTHPHKRIRIHTQRDTQKKDRCQGPYYYSQQVKLLAEKNREPYPILLKGGL